MGQSIEELTQQYIVLMRQMALFRKGSSGGWNMKSWRRIFTYLASLPADLLWGWPCILLMWLLFGENLRWEGEALVCQIKPNAWPVNKAEFLGGWYLHDARPWGGTTPSPHAIFYGPGHVFGGTRDTWFRIQRHEHVHVKQGETAQVGSFLAGGILAVFGYPLAGIAIWTFAGYLLMGVSGWVTAWLRGEAPYRLAQHEESAYALQDDSRP